MGWGRKTLERSSVGNEGLNILRSSFVGVGGDNCALILFPPDLRQSPTRRILQLVFAIY